MPRIRSLGDVFCYFVGFILCGVCYGTVLVCAECCKECERIKNEKNKNKESTQPILSNNDFNQYTNNNGKYPK